MKYITLFLFVFSLTVLVKPGKRILELGNNASLPAFTTDHQNRPVLFWVEKSDNKPVLCYRISRDGGQTFDATVRIPTPAATSVHTEGRPKLAFRKDGTIYATFEVRKPTETNTRASDILYSTSSDEGKTWSLLQPLHRNVRPGGSHSFHDLTRLSNGEVAAVWLDEKLAGKEGRTVKFSQTDATGRFGNEILIDSSACQCCRTSVVSENNGAVHVAYRDLLPNGSRDIGHAVSTNGGRTFSPPQVVYADHWQIQACPHSGPQLLPTPKGLWITWHSGVENNAGIRLKSLSETKLTVKPENPAMHFPQIAALSNGQVALCWEEWIGEGPDAYRKIGLKLGNAAPIYLTPAGEMCMQPTLTQTTSGLLMAYVQSAGENSKVMVLKL